MVSSLCSKFSDGFSSQGKAKVLTTTDNPLRSALCTSFPALPVTPPPRLTASRLFLVHRVDTLLTRFSGSAWGAGLPSTFYRPLCWNVTFQWRCSWPLYVKLSSLSLFHFSLSIYHNVAYLVFYLTFLLCFSQLKYEQGILSVLFMLQHSTWCSINSSWLNTVYLSLSGEKRKAKLFSHIR